jgi:hypothetical protein
VLIFNYVLLPAFVNRPVLPNLTTSPIEKAGLSDFLAGILRKNPWKEKKVEAASL